MTEKERKSIKKIEKLEKYLLKFQAYEREIIIKNNKIVFNYIVQEKPKLEKIKIKFK